MLTHFCVFQGSVIWNMLVKLIFKLILRNQLIVRGLIFYGFSMIKTCNKRKTLKINNRHKFICMYYRFYLPP